MSCPFDIPAGLKVHGDSPATRGLVATRAFAATDLIAESVPILLMPDGLQNSQICVVCRQEMSGGRHVCTDCGMPAHVKCISHHSSTWCEAIRAIPPDLHGVEGDLFAFMWVFLLKLAENPELFGAFEYLTCHKDKFLEDRSRYTAFLDIAKRLLETQNSGAVRIPESSAKLSSPEFVAELICTYSVNNFRWMDEKFADWGVGFDFLVALVNHSCIPNCYVYASHDKVYIRALTDIPEGSQLTMTYAEGMQGLDSRQSFLQWYYFFECQCPLCAYEQISPSDALQCSRCTRLFLPWKCPWCGNEVDEVQFNSTLSLVQKFLHSSEVRNFVASPEAVKNTLSIQTNAFSSLVKLATHTDLPYCREPFHELCDIIIRVSAYQGDFDAVFLTHFVLVCRSSVLTDAHLVVSPSLAAQLCVMLSEGIVTVKRTKNTLLRKHMIVVLSAMKRYLTKYPVKCHRYDDNEFDFEETTAGLHTAASFEWLMTAFFDLVGLEPDSCDAWKLARDQSKMFYDMIQVSHP